MAIGDIFELALTGAQSGQVVVNTYHCKQLATPTTPSGDPEQDLIDGWQAACQTAYRAMHGTGFSLAQISARQVCGATKPYRARKDESVNLAGTFATSLPLAAWLASVVRERTALSGRTYQGRNFYVAPDESVVAGTALSAPYIALVDAYNAAIMSIWGPSGSSADWDLVVFSRKLNNNEAGHCSTDSAAVTSLSTSPYLTTMRSRRSRTGV